MEFNSCRISFSNICSGFLIVGSSPQKGRNIRVKMFFLWIFSLGLHLHFSWRISVADSSNYFAP